MRLILHHSPGACSMAVHIALEEAGAEYEARTVSVHAGETASPTFRALNPRGRVPVLEADGAVLTETLAILVFLARRFPAAGLLPDDPLAEARCLSTLSWIASSVHPTFAHIVRPERFADDPAAHDALRARGTADYWDRLAEMDRLIGDGPWFMRDRFTACDAHALPFWGFGRRIRLPMRELPRLAAWKERMLARPAVLRALRAENSPLLKPGG